MGSVCANLFIFAPIAVNDFLQSPLVGFLNRNTRTGLIKLRTLNGTTHQFQVLYTKARATGVRKSPECKTLLRMERTVPVLLLLLWHPDTGTPSTTSVTIPDRSDFPSCFPNSVPSFLPCPYYGQLLIYRISVGIGRQKLVRLQCFKLVHLLVLALGLD